MEESKKEAPIYPLRSSELVQQEELFAEVEPISLTDKERQELLDFEQELFNRLEPLKKISSEVLIHTLYPDYFLTDKGWRLFQLVYLDPNLKKRAEARASEEKVSLEDEKEKKRFYDKIFDELRGAIKDESHFQEHKKEEKIELKKVKRPENRDEVVRLFFDLEDLTEVPTQVRHRTARVSSDYTRDQFLERFQAQNGEVEKMANPYRITRVIDVDKLMEKVGGYREFKGELKEIIRKSREGKDNLPEAKAILAQVYLRYLNTLIAGSYRYGRVLTSQPELSAKEKQALDLVKGIRSTLTKEERFADEKASRTMEKIDQFLQGVGIEVGEDGLLKIKRIPEKLREYIGERAALAKAPETPEYQKYNAIKVNAEQAKRLAEPILSAGEFDKRGWTAYISPTKKAFSVSYREKGEIVREFNVPQELDKGLVDVLVILEHEMSHVLQHDNREQAMGKLALIREFSTGRAGILLEAGAMWVSDQARDVLVKMPRLGLPYYGLMLLEKQRGGSFKDCYRTYLENYARIKIGTDLNGLLENKEEWKDISKRAFSCALRIFARQTPLEDKSGFLPTSKQLQYLEQELTAQTLFDKGWGRILFTAGIGLYSLRDLTRLGMLDWGKIREPQFWVARELWPKLKTEIDQGKSLDEAIDAIQK